ncbi:Membrane transporter [Aphelenchoides fujianensis]|nr:Membrane transporter [Aphelenchoides fujianensis]
MESELNTWLRRANAFGTKVDVNVKGLIAAHQRKVKMDETKDQNIVLQVVRNRRLLIRMLLMAFLWISDTLIYYGLSLYSTQLAGNKYVNYVLLGLIEAPSNFASPYFLNVFGRRMFISGTHGLAAIAFLLLIFIKHPTGALVLWLVGKFGIICSFNCLYVYCSELYPTNVRSGCTGACEAVGRLASTFAPALHSLKTIYVELPTIIFTALAAASGGLTLLLPETKDAVLPDTAADIEMTEEVDATIEEIDDVLNRFSWKNSYFLLIFSSSASIWLFAAMSVMVSAFTVGSTCADSPCNLTEGTISKDFDLQGDRSRLADFSTSAYAVGSMIGALGLTRVADLKGRRPLAILSLLFSGLLGCAAAFVPNIYLFMFVRCLQGITFVGCSINSWVLAYESVPKHLRDFSTLVFGMILPCVASAVAFFFYLPESFRFMVMHERTEDLDRFLQRVKRAEPTGASGNSLDARLLIAQYKRITEPAMQSRLFTELAADRMLIACTVSATVCAFNALFVSASEIFPTTIRSGCIGICEITARIGAAFAPVFHSFESGDPQTMKIIYAAAGFVGSCATLVIPETSKTPLPDTAKKQTPRDIVE